MFDSEQWMTLFKELLIVYGLLGIWLIRCVTRKRHANKHRSHHY